MKCKRRTVLLCHGASLIGNEMLLCRWSAHFAAAASGRIREGLISNFTIHYI